MPVRQRRRREWVTGAGAMGPGETGIEGTWSGRGGSEDV